MDRKKFQKWFNDGYGKLPPERQLEELKILKEYIDEFFNEKYNSFETISSFDITSLKKLSKLNFLISFINRSFLDIEIIFIL